MALKVVDTQPTGDELKPKPAEGKPNPTPANPLDVKIEGEGVDPKYQGKTVAEIIEMNKTGEGVITRLQTENKQWAESSQQNRDQRTDISRLVIGRNHYYNLHIEHTLTSFGQRSKVPKVN